MAFCSNCGQELTGEEKYCPKCGKETRLQIQSHNETWQHFEKQVPSKEDKKWQSYEMPVTKPKKEKTGFSKAVLILIAVLAGFVIFLDLVSSDEYSNDQPDTPTEEVQVPSFTEVSTTLGNWEITINDFNFQESVRVGLLHEYHAEDGCKYCIVDLTVKNCGKEAEVFLPYFSFDDSSAAKIKWNGLEYTRSELFFADDMLSSEGLNPLVSTTGQIVFEMPMEAENSDEIPVLVIKANGKSFKCDLVKSINAE